SRRAIPARSRSESSPMTTRIAPRGAHSTANRPLRVSDPNANTAGRHTDGPPSGCDLAALLVTHANGGDVMQRPTRNLAARMGRWSAGHRKTAIFGWLAFVLLSIVIGSMVGQKTIDQQNSNVGQ